MTPEQLAARGLRVKPLVWVDDVNGGFYGSADIGHGFTIYYAITQLEFELAEVEFGVLCHDFGGKIVWRGPKALAKAAAEADHVARVLAMIEGME